ncbi:hypothetical protein [Alkalibacterium sp.]|nr:MAG: hypothetical protein EA249_09635 [Alkalibacterium sp.]
MGCDEERNQDEDAEYSDLDILDRNQGDLKLKFDGRKKFKTGGFSAFHERLEYLDPFIEQVGAEENRN